MCLCPALPSRLRPWTRSRPPTQALTDVASLVKAYQAVINMYRLKWVDFDIEASLGGGPMGPCQVSHWHPRRRQAPLERWLLRPAARCC